MRLQELRPNQGTAASVISKNQKNFISGKVHLPKLPILSRSTENLVDIASTTNAEQSDGGKAKENHPISINI